jgi:hypothetical protein
VGVWVKGPDSPLHPLVAAACLKFYYASTLLDRALQGEGAFLLLLCPEGARVAGRWPDGGGQEAEAPGVPCARPELVHGVAGASC